MDKIIWTDEAVHWLKVIYDYISINDPEAAVKVLNNIIDETMILKDFPNIGAFYKKNGNSEIRSILYGHYKIAYIVRYDHIEILGVFHDKMEIEHYFKNW